MPAPTDKAYQISTLTEYPFRQRLVIRLVGLMSFLMVKALGKTLRFETEGWEHFEQIELNGHQPIYCFWHDRILAGTYFFRKRGIVVMTSQSRDGEYIARFIQKFGYGVARGSSSRGGTGALVELIRAMRGGRPAAFTVDVPRGPKYEAKPGPVLLAQKTGAPMMPFVFECKKFWQMRSWDGLRVPKPFSRVRLIIDAPIYVAAGGSEEDLKLRLAELQHSLDNLVERGRKWREQD